MSDRIITKPQTQAYRDGWERAFGIKPEIAEMAHSIREYQQKRRVMLNEMLNDYGYELDEETVNA